MTAEFVSIIVPTFRRPSVLTETLAALIKLNHSKDAFEIIVVDDGSNDETSNVVKSFQDKFANLKYLPQSNSGVATARNNGARAARGDILIFNDDDIIVAPDLIERHLRHLREFGACLVNGHWEFAPAMADYFEQTPFGRFRTNIEVWVKTDNDKKLLRDGVYESQTASACNLGVRRADYWRIGGFDEQFPFAGCEDHEFVIRARKLGYKFIYDFDLKLLHNDHRISVEQFGERQRRGAITKVLIAHKQPEEEADHPLITENDFIRRGEPFKLSAKKALKKTLATPPAFAALITATRVLESTWKNSPLLPRLYNAAAAVYIFRGIREGLARYGEPKTSHN